MKRYFYHFLSLYVDVVNKVSEFKFLIVEFQELQFPVVRKRDLLVADSDHIITIYGSRRSGKTYFFYQLINSLLDQNVRRDQILYINFEDDRIFPLELDNLQNLLDAYYTLYPDNIDSEKYFFFDEIQNIENWELFVRRIHDKEKVRLFITGSSSKLLGSEIATALRGRTLSYQFFPLSFLEFLRFKGIEMASTIAYSSIRYRIIKLLDDYIQEGGYPELVEYKSIKKELLSTYYQAMIIKDLIDRFSIRNSHLLKDLAQYLLTNIANIFSINAYHKSIKNTHAASINTIAEYFSYLREINLVYQVKFFSYSLKVQQSRPVKIYCIDTGLRNVVSFKFSKDEGRLVENIVYLHLNRSGKEVYYWKSKKGHEVDFAYKTDGGFHAINVSYYLEDNLPQRELRGLMAFDTEFKAKSLLIISKDTEDEIDDIEIVPLWKWLLGI